MAFNCVRAEPYDQAFRDISARHGIAYWDDVASVVLEAHHRGEDVYAADGGHWNERGHQLAAEAIASHFRAEMRTGTRP
ncbi:MAG: SGNH/GDSL hydrolase family protein [Nitrospira sp.]|nr:SGNH/GDSL hydrolase family protein [Nitrospira sp.]